MNDWFNETHQTCIKHCYEQYKFITLQEYTDKNKMCLSLFI